MSEEIKWLWPVPDTKISDISQNYTGAVGVGHSGIDINTNDIYGKNVVASRSGKVVRIFSGCNNHNAATTHINCSSETSCACNGLTQSKTYGVYVCNEGLGNAIIIEHDDGKYSQYCHLQTIKVQLNQDVSQGDIIGTVGSTGESEVPHLHFSLSTSYLSFETTRFDNNPDVIDYVYEIEQPTQTIK